MVGVDEVGEGLLGRAEAGVGCGFAGCEDEVGLLGRTEAVVIAGFGGNADDSVVGIGMADGFDGLVAGGWGFGEAVLMNSTETKCISFKFQRAIFINPTII